MSDPSTTRAAWLLGTGVLVLSAAVIFLELLSMRLLSFMLWHHLAYMVLSVAMLGFGASGAWLASSLRERDPVTTIASSAALFGVTSVVGFAILSRVGLDTFEMGALKLVKLGFYYVVLLVPYFFAGLAMAVVFRSWPRMTTRLYAINLVGSGLGCWIFMVALPLLGGPGALLGAAAMGALASAAWFGSRSLKHGTVALAGALALGGLVPLSGAIFPFSPAASKSLAVYMQVPGATIEFTRWTPLARIDVVWAPRAPHPFMGRWVDGDQMRTITIDGDANTWMFRHPSLDEVDTSVTVDKLRPNTYSLAFMLRPSPSRVLVIGAGGGNEVAMALAANAGHVTGVELNEAILEQSRDRLRDFFGGFYQTPRATAVNAEGRSFVRSSSDRYDVIQMSGVDTWSGLSTGAYVLSENYLYTVDATRDFLEHLAPSGLLSIGRFRLEPPRETLRLLANALQAMRELGWPDPASHVMVVSIGHLDQARILVGESPFDPAEVLRVRDLLDSGSSPGNAVWYAPHITDSLQPNPFIDLVRAFKEGPEAERLFHDAYRYDVTPVHDDRPFFFEYYKWRNFIPDMIQAGRGGQIGANRPVGLTILAFMIVQVIVLCLIFIFAPLLRLRLAGRRLRGGALLAVGFGGLGLGFMFLEVGLMQKLVLLLGHPTHSISTILFAILVGSGLGSLLSGRLPWPVHIRIIASISAVVALTLVASVTLDPITMAILGKPFVVRQIVAVLLVGLLAVPMGMPFPLSLECASRMGPAAVPWAWGINGGASVLGSILCIVMAMSMGFRAVLLSSALVYLAALPCLAILARRAGRP